MLRQPRGKPESSESVCQPVENLKIDAVSEVADTKRKSRRTMWIDKPARCALLFLDHRIPVVRLKIVPEKSLPKLHPEIFKFRECQEQGSVEKFWIHCLLQIRRDPEYTAQIFSGHRRKKFCRVVQSPPCGALDAPAFLCELLR